MSQPDHRHEIYFNTFIKSQLRNTNAKINNEFYQYRKLSTKIITELKKIFCMQQRLFTQKINITNPSYIYIVVDHQEIFIIT